MSSILFIAPSAYIYGGLATWLDYLVPGLESAGWDVTVGLVSGKHHNAGAYLNQHPFRKSLAIENKSGSWEGRIRAISRAIRKVGPDLVVGVNIPDAYAAVERLRLTKALNCKVVMTLHGILPDLYEDMKQYSELLDGVVCTNKLACILAAKAGGMEAARIHYAPYGVSLNSNEIASVAALPRNDASLPGARPPEDGSVQRFMADNDTSLRGGEADEAILKIIHVGRIGDDFQKRVTDIPEIVSLLDQAGLKYELRIVGSGDREQELKEKMARQISEGRVNFTGALFGDALSNLYDWADVMLLTSFWETGPIVLWEAMVRKAAVVSSSYVGSGSEGSLVNGQNCLLFPIGGTKSAAECLIKVADSELRTRLTENGYKLVLERYAREISIGLWDKAFKKILAAQQSVIPESTLSFPRRRESRPGPPTKAFGGDKTGRCGNDIASRISPSGRLDSIVGVSLAESLREVLGIRFEHKDAGGEWPHAYSAKAQDDKEFWEIAKELDVGVVQ